MATTVKTLAKLANELHAAYTALIEFDNESARLELAQPITFFVRERRYQRELLKKQEEKATDRLALAIEKAPSERLAQAEIAVGQDVVYVFDGF